MTNRILTLVLLSVFAVACQPGTATPVLTPSETSSLPSILTATTTPSPEPTPTPPISTATPTAHPPPATTVPTVEPTQAPTEAPPVEYQPTSCGDMEYATNAVGKFLQKHGFLPDDLAAFTPDDVNTALQQYADVLPARSLMKKFSISLVSYGEGGLYSHFGARAIAVDMIELTMKIGHDEVAQSCLVMINFNKWKDGTVTANFFPAMLDAYVTNGPNKGAWFHTPYIWKQVVKDGSLEGDYSQTYTVGTDRDKFLRYVQKLVEGGKIVAGQFFFPAQYALNAQAEYLGRSVLDIGTLGGTIDLGPNGENWPDITGVNYDMGKMIELLNKKYSGAAFITNILFALSEGQTNPYYPSQ